MRYNKLGRTGLFVSELCLGTMTFGGESGHYGKFGNVGQDDADAMVRAAIDVGINFFDSADVYSAGQAEEILGQSIRNLGLRRDDIVVATKAFAQMGDGPNARGASRAHLLAAAEASLKRLQLDHIDLYQIHGFDVATPIEETLRALDALVQRGVVRYIGVSNWAAWQIAKAVGISERLSLARFESLQAYYTVSDRDLERELGPAILSEDLGLMVWSPLAGGLLSGKYAKDDLKEGKKGRRAEFEIPPIGPKTWDVIDAMRPIADAHDVSVARVALAWLLHQPVVTTIILGARRIDQLQDNFGAIDLALSDRELEVLDACGKLRPEYPAWLMSFQGEYRRKQLAESGRTQPATRWRH